MLVLWLLLSFISALLNFTAFSLYGDTVAQADLELSVFSRVQITSICTITPPIILFLCLIYVYVMLIPDKYSYICHVEDEDQA